MSQPGVAERPASEPRPAFVNERRVVGRALAHWETLRGSRRFPSHDDVTPESANGLGDNIFVIALLESEDKDKIVSSGNAFRDALTFDPVGRKVVEILPSATEKGLSFCHTAAALKKPIADVGRFTNADGKEIRYRSILLPLSDDQ
jgi:hypothetical protein